MWMFCLCCIFKAYYILHWKEEAMHSEVVPSLLRMHTQLCIVLDARLRTFVACSTIYENLRFCANFSLRTLEGQASACVHACVQCSLHLSRWISVLPTVDWSAYHSSNTNGLWRSCEDPPEVCSEVPAETCFRPACFLIAWLNLVARKICVWVTVGDQRLVFLTIECICCTFLDFGCNGWRFDNYRSRKAKSAAGTYGALQHCKTPGRNLSFTNISEPMHAPRYRWNYKNNACMFFPQHSLSH